MNIKFEKKIIFNFPDKRNKENSSGAIFFDRDGVINEDCHYIKDPNQVKLCLGAKVLIRKIFQKNIPIVIITNQSGISKKYLNWEEYNLVTKRIIYDLGEPNPLSAIYANSYKDTNNGNNWRKPNPNMIIQASKDLKIDLNKSILIGDRLTDLEAGYRSGIKTLIHVMTGHGSVERDEVINNFKNEHFTKENRNKIKTILINDLLGFPIKLLN